MSDRARCVRCHRWVDVQKGKLVAHLGEGGQHCQGSAKAASRARNDERELNQLATFTSAEGLASLIEAKRIAEERKEAERQWWSKSNAEALRLFEKRLEEERKALKLPRITVVNGGLSGNGKHR